MSNNVNEKKQVNSLPINVMVISGKEMPFSNKSVVPINGKATELEHKQLVEKMVDFHKWNININGLEFITYYAGKGDNFTDMLKDGKIVISNLGFQSIKRILENSGKSAYINKAHNQYLIAVHRISKKSQTVITGTGLDI